MLVKWYYIAESSTSILLLKNIIVTSELIVRIQNCMETFFAYLIMLINLVDFKFPIFEGIKGENRAYLKKNIYNNFVLKQAVFLFDYDFLWVQ